MDKIDRLLDALEHPERFTPTEIDTLLSDPEVKRTFDILDKTKSSLHPIITPDVEGEWKKFENKHLDPGLKPRFSFRDLLTRNVAASIVIGILSLSAVAAIVGIGISRHNRTEVSTPIVEAEHESRSATVIAQSQSESLTTEEETKEVSQELKIFDNETLETILSDIAVYYGCTVIFGKDSAKSLRLYFRWDNSLSLNEVAERLNNFEQIHLTVEDNTIKVD